MIVKSLSKLFKMHRKNLIPLIIVAVVLIFVGKLIISNLNVFPFVFQLIFNRDIQLKQSDNRINILLLGIGGGTHEGPDLTDTIILASIDPKADKVTLISIPRDLWFPDINGKINSAYAIGEAKKTGGGLILAESAVGKITGQNIDYGVRIDFSGFVKAVDIAGGLDINVDNTFDDYQYPIDGKENDSCGHSQDELKALANTSEDQLPSAFPCRYIHLHFNKGLIHMNGETTLEFVRSRHALGVEGSDFARSKRQAKVIKAFKDKVLSAQTILNPAKIINLYETLSSSIDADIQQTEFDDFLRLAQKMKNAKIQSTVIDTGDQQTQRSGLLINPPPSSDYNYQWVLAPRTGNGNFTEIQKYVDCEVKTGNCLVSIKPPK